MSRVDVSIKRLDPAVSLPEYAYSGDAGLDLRCNESVDLAPFERRLVSTGLAIALPDGYAGFVQPRSGLALKRGLSIVNTPGLIDVIQEVPTVCLHEVDELDETDRGAGGFGSSGVA